MPLYEAKMVHHYDHRFGDYANQPEGAEGTSLPDVPIARLNDPDYAPLPRYWVPVEEVEVRLAGWWDRGWLLGWRDVCRNTDQRTVIASVVPRVGVGDKFLLMLPRLTPTLCGCLLANLCSICFDYSARQKIGGTSRKYFTMKQLPVLTPSTFELPAAWDSVSTRSDWLQSRVLELTYTAWDLEPFARDLGYDGPPYRWDEERRFLLRAELDAAFFHLYGVSREDADYILDTFPIVRRHDEAAHGEYRTKRVILEVYDAMAEAAAAGKPYRTLLDPPPADSSIAHPPRVRRESATIGAGAAGSGDADLAPARDLPFERVEPAPGDRYRTCVPLLTLKAAAGAFSEPQEVEPEGWVRPRTRRTLAKGVFVAQVRGRSMEPQIPDGAWCLFQGPVTGTRNGRILLVEHRAIADPETGGSYTVKRYRSEKQPSSDEVWKHARIRLEPLNPGYTPLELDGTAEDEIRVIAEMIEVLDASR